MELKFPTLEAAVGYCERQGLNYAVQWPHDSKTEVPERRSVEAHTRSDIVLDGAGLSMTVANENRASRSPANQNDPPRPGGGMRPSTS